MGNILIIDEEPALARHIAKRLSEEGYQAESYQSTKAVIRYLARNRSFDLVLVGTQQTYSNYSKVYQRLKSELTCPIILIVAPEDGDGARQLLFDAAANLFIKPLDSEALVERVRELCAVTESVDEREQIQRIGPLGIARKSGVVRFKEQVLRLSAREFQVLDYLASRVGQTVSREELSGAICSGDAQHSTANITVYIKNLRDKFDPDSRFIKTIWGEGYMLVDPTTKPTNEKSN